ncbi:chalcone-flavanone isomerase [Xylariaceae sp. FL0016]|nr:chalcone-flavanone isomerase [Xylariaceae sp. FL0016]
MRGARCLPVAPSLRSLASRPACVFRSTAARSRTFQPGQIQCRTFLRPERGSFRAVESFNVNRMRHESYEYYIRRRNFLMAGAISGVLAICYTTYLIVLERRKPNKFDSGLPDKLDPFSTEAGSKRKTVVHDAEGREIVPTGDSTIPTFPRLLALSFGTEHGQEMVNGVEYTLVGLGVRTVSFLGIRVYMVGYYVATHDIAAVQARLVKEINPIATTLVPSEKEELRKALLDPEKGEELWNTILRDARPRSLFRIVPVRDTDFHHMRDGFVRAITARTQGDNTQYNDEAFGLAMKDFKNLFNRGKVPKGKEMLLCRDSTGVLTVTFDDGKSGIGSLGKVEEERLSRLLWLNWLAGKNVASDAARKNIVEGIMEFVERPIGTVATQVI